MADEKFRKLNERERNIARMVFKETLPLDMIWIGDDLGYSGCPWMEVEGIFSPEAFTMHMGYLGFRDSASNIRLQHDGDPARYTLVHELTHVWQAHKENKWVFTRSAARRSCQEVGNVAIKAANYVKEQLGSSGTISNLDMYAYEPGLEWNDYNVEQQAKIVEHWYSGFNVFTSTPEEPVYGEPMSRGSVLYTYMTNHIWNC
jgi:hypothetical protein